MPETLPIGLRYAATFPQLVRTTSMSMYGNRAISFIETADPVWHVPMRVTRMTNAHRQKLEGFISRCRDGLVTVHYTPKHVCLPQAYWGDGANPILTNTGALTTISGNVLTIASVTSGLKLTDGDLIGFTLGEYNFIARVVADAVAVSASITVRIEPFLPSYITTGATVIFKNPVMNMRLKSSSYQCGEGAFPDASFDLIEVPK